MPQGAIGFSGPRLREAREARGLTGVSLAEIAGVTPAMISQYEHGAKLPQPGVLERIAGGLNLPVPFFLQPHDPNEDAVDSPLSFRSMSAATKTARTREERRFRWHVSTTHYIERFATLPTVNFPTWDLPGTTDLNDEDINLIASKLRRFWGLSDDPVADMVELLEKNGAVVVRCDLGARVLDAYSGWSRGRPHIILGADKMVAVRSRYDVAHELAHLILHRNVIESELKRSELHKEIERQANFFAGAFLLPVRTFSEEFGVPTLDAMLPLKLKWRVSVGAMIFRAGWLNLISADQQERLWIANGRRGWRTHEPYDDEIPVEQPRTLRAAFELARGSPSFTLGGLRASLKYSDSDIEQLCGLPHGYLQGLPHPEMRPLTEPDDEFRLINFPTR
jgi:Zn-dependent peptidase ImmA (M78 family)/transcriptional regulator with XRE-family HTH domain